MQTTFEQIQQNRMAPWRKIARSTDREARALVSFNLSVALFHPPFRILHNLPISLLVRASSLLGVHIEERKFALRLCSRNFVAPLHSHTL